MILPTSGSNASWPVAFKTSGDGLRQVALPLGGIGTGCLALGGRGDLRDWEIGNKPSKGHRPEISFLVLRVDDGTGAPRVLALEGPLDGSAAAGAFGSADPSAGLPRFSDAQFSASYPFGRVELRSTDMPVRAAVTAMSPLIPADVDSSAMPLAVLTIEVESLADVDLEVDAAFLVSPDVIPATGDAARARVVRQEELTGVLVALGEPGSTSESAGTFAIASLGSEAATAVPSWPQLGWRDSLLVCWRHFVETGGLIASTEDMPTRPMAAVADRRQLRAHAATTFTFLLAWHFPHRRGWALPDDDRMEYGAYSDAVIGNHYTERFENAWQVLCDTAPGLDGLVDASRQFVSDVVDSDLPPAIAEAALACVSTLRTQTCFRSRDGRFHGWEGTGDDTGSCPGTCTHVWNYEFVTPYLFGELAADMRSTELDAVDGEGRMPFRILQPDPLATWPVAAADGQCGAIVKLWREFRLSGDRRLLARWPAARRALEFCWLPGGWDAGRTGVMRGVQHNTMDVEYVGPNPQIQGWYAAALAAAAELARAAGDDDFAVECRALADRARGCLDRDLFDGSYYRQLVEPLASDAVVLPGLVRSSRLDQLTLPEPPHQVGAGCFIDQLVGDVAARAAGLAPVFNERNAAAAAASILRHNRRQESWSDFNPMRTFALHDEPAVAMCSFPNGSPARPFPYFAEAMPGFEYTLATELAYLGDRDAAVGVVTDVRRRHDGRRRNPFNEPECGHHYARSMAAWGLVVAWSGFDYDAVTATLGFRREVGSRWFWSTGTAWGVVTQTAGEVSVDVRGGELWLERLVCGSGHADLPRQKLSAGSSVTAGLAEADG